MQLRKSHDHYSYTIVGIVIGSVLGWVLAPVGYQSIGLGIGGGIGIASVSLWQGWGRHHSAMPIGPFGHLIYTLAAGLNICMLWLAIRTWSDQPDTWLATMLGLLFFGTGIVVLYVLWKIDSSPVSEFKSSLEGKYNIMLSICSFIFAFAGVVTIFLGLNLVIGVAGTLFFSWCGVAYLRREQSFKSERQPHVGL